MAEIANAVATEDIASPPEPAKSSTKTFVLIGVALILLMGAGGAAWWVMGRSKKAPIKGKPETPQIRAILHLNSFLVNLADPEENRFLRIEIDLGLEHELGKSETEGGAPPTARIRDTILTVLMTWRSDGLLTPDGKAKLKAELVRALRERAPELGVREVYFNDFLVQR